MWLICGSNLFSFCSCSSEEDDLELLADIAVSVDNLSVCNSQSAKSQEAVIWLDGQQNSCVLSSQLLVIFDFCCMEIGRHSWVMCKDYDLVYQAEMICFCEKCEMEAAVHINRYLTLLLLLFVYRLLLSW